MKTISKSVHIGTGKQSIKNRKTLSMISNHNARVHESYQNENIDLERTILNEVLIGSGNEMEDVKRFYDEKLEASFNEWRDKAIQKNPQRFNDGKDTETYLDKQVREAEKEIATQIVFQVGNESFWNDRSDEQKRDLSVKAFESWSYEMSQDERYQNLKIVSATLHMDETSPHIHVMAVPIKHSPNRGQEYQVSKNHVFGNNKEMERFHELSDMAIERVIKQELGNDWELVAPLNDDKALPLDVREYRQQIRALNELHDVVTERSEGLDAKLQELSKHEIEADENIKKISFANDIISNTSSEVSNVALNRLALIESYNQRHTEAVSDDIEVEIEAIREEAIEKDSDIKLSKGIFKEDSVVIPIKDFAETRQHIKALQDELIEVSNHNQNLESSVNQLSESNLAVGFQSQHYERTINNRDNQIDALVDELNDKSRQLIENKFVVDAVQEYFVDMEQEYELKQIVADKLLGMKELSSRYEIKQYKKLTDEHMVYESVNNKSGQQIDAVAYMREKEELSKSIEEHQNTGPYLQGSIKILRDAGQYLHDRKSEQLEVRLEILESLKPDLFHENIESKQRKNERVRESRDYDMER